MYGGFRNFFFFQKILHHLIVKHRYCLEHIIPALLGLFLKMILKNRAALWQMTQRLARFAAQPSNIYWAFRGLFLALGNLDKGGFGYFQFWFFAWTNAVLKYRYISDGDFDIESVPEAFDIKDILPSDYAETADEAIPPQKIKAQLRATTAQLESVIAERAS